MECIPNALERALESCFQTSSARDFFHPTSTAAISEFEATAPNISAPFCHRRDFRHVENRTGDLPTHRHHTRLPAASTDTEMLNFAILLIVFLFLVRHYLLRPKAKSKRFVLFIRRKRDRTLTNFALRAMLFLGQTLPDAPPPLILILFPPPRRTPTSQRCCPSRQGWETNTRLGQTIPPRALGMVLRAKMEL